MQIRWTRDGKFESKTELAKLYSTKGISAKLCVVTHYNEGLHAVPPWFVLTEILGYQNVKLHDNSMAEWANSDRKTFTSSERRPGNRR